ncbi:MAG: enoyl-CoA hydratase/isomerase family protein [Dehalococcoidia bacterium]|nr:enoyl-CoA hydratase/isomerase family protein [Dehalococcoidia bacterium]
MAYEDILYEVGDDGVATLTLNRPERMNALRPQTTTEMREVIADAKNNDAVRCLLITGAGRGFCAGDDFQAIFLAPERGSRQNARQIRRITHGDESLDDIFALEKPTVAAVNGAAVGYGMDLSLYCDIRIASENAKFGWYFTRRAVMGTVGGTFILRQLVGLSKAFELTLTGDLVDAQEAARIGLVSKVVPNDQLMDDARAMARKLASGAPLAQRAVKRAMHKGFQMDWRSLAEYQQSLGDVLWQTEDHMEGVNSFTEKREPHYKGR